MASQLYRVPTQNNLQYTLAQQLTQGGTTAVLNTDVTGIVQTPGVFVVDRVDASGNKTPTVREYISFTGQSTTNLTGLGKGLGGSTDQAHQVGAIVEFIPDIVWAESYYDVITREHDIFGVHSSLPSLANIVTKLGVVQSLASIQSGIFTNLISASGASITGFFPSNASGALIQLTGTNAPVAIPYISTATDGWLSDSNSLVYVSANSFKITGTDVHLQYPKGTRIKFTNNSATFYGVVISSTFSTDTTVTLAPNDDYSINNSAITSPFYSYQVNPQGYPGKFNFASTIVWTGFSAAPTGGSGKVEFSVVGNVCTMYFESVSGTSNSATFNCTCPVAPVNVNTAYVAEPILVFDNSAWQSTIGVVGINNGSTTLHLGLTPSTIAANAYAGFTNTGSKGTSGMINYYF